MSIKKINIDQLKVGMYITSLDISWFDSPFLKHSRLIKSSQDIKSLIKAGVKNVSIDIKKGLDISEQQLDDISSGENDSNTTDNHISVDEQGSNEQKKASLEDEIDAAIMLKEQASKAFSNLSQRIKDNKPLNMEEVMPVVDESINSLSKNNQALLTLMHMQRSEKDLFSHTFSTMSLLLSLAMSLGYSKEQLRQYGLAALLHDLGWSKIPLNLLSKNKPYTASEEKIVKQHLTLIVQQLLRDKGIEHDIIKLISHHHERGDGSGYPKGFTLKDIPEESSLLALVDYYDELVHGLLDSPGVIPSVALKLLYKEALNSKFYKKHVEQLVFLLGVYPMTSAVELSSGEKAVVAVTHRATPLKPSVKIMYDSQGRGVVNPCIIDLRDDEQKREIRQVIDISEPGKDPLGLLSVREAAGGTND